MHSTTIPSTEIKHQRVILNIMYDDYYLQYKAIVSTMWFQCTREATMQYKYLSTLMQTLYLDKYNKFKNNIELLFRQYNHLK